MQRLTQGAYKALFLCLMIGLAGCFGGANVRPESPAQRLAVVDAQFVAAVNTSTDLRAAGVLGDSQWSEAKRIAADGSDALDAGWDAVRVLNLCGQAEDVGASVVPLDCNPATLLDYVTVANRLLLDLRKMLPEGTR